MRNKKMRIVTTLNNEDHLKYMKLLRTYVESGKEIKMSEPNKCCVVDIEFEIIKGCVKGLKRDVGLLNFVGVIGFLEEA